MSAKVFDQMKFRGHEQVVFFHFPEVGLKAIIGIHNTVLGPALGGCRMRNYTCEEEALDDVLRLSEGMTYKSSLAGLNLGGGKACVLADPEMKEGRRELFLKFGECLNRLNGTYITAEDMGTSV
ncbi:MAG: leucine dehydrogenase, partial [Candidatus Dadabacteria bacterium]